MINSKSRLAQQFYEEGKACPIYDFHGHMHEMSGGCIPRCDPANMARLMDRAGIKRLVYASHFAIFGPDYEKECHQDVVRQYPNHFKAYHGILARYSQFDTFRKNMEENKDVYVGAKYLGDYNGTAVDDEILRPFWDYLHENKMLVLLHTWGGSPYNGEKPVENVVRRYPGITFVLGHSFHDHWREGMALAKRYPNIYYELTATHDNHDVIGDLAKHVGSDRMLFGTDLPWFNSYLGIGSILAADMTDAEREDIFYGNAMRLSEHFTWLK